MRAQKSRPKAASFVQTSVGLEVVSNFPTVGRWLVKW